MAADGAPTGAAPAGALRRAAGLRAPGLLAGRASGLLLVLALLGLWQLSAMYWIESSNWPTLGAIARALWKGLASGELFTVFGSSLALMGSGYAIGTALAVALGLLMAQVRLVRVALDPMVELLRPIPVPAIIPPLILVLGVDSALKVFIVAFSAFFPVLVNTAAGVRAVEPVELDVARTLRVGRMATLWSVVLPASLPWMLAGMRISLALALIVTVVAEMIAGSSGIGFHIMTMQYAMRADDMYAAIGLLAATGYALNRCFLAIERRAIHWYLATGPRD